MIFPNFKTELELYNSGYCFVAGCDEVGVGPLAGPVVAAACILDPGAIGKQRGKNKWYYRVRDSKTTDEKERARLLPEIMEHCIAFGIGKCSPEQIDSLNIHHATLLAMKIAFEDLAQKLAVVPKPAEVAVKDSIYLILDGRFTIKDLQCDNFRLDQRAMINADQNVLSVSAASIIAKEHRDAILRKMDFEFPGYGFSRHKGYNTKEHKQAIQRLGITVHHRKSFLKNFNLVF